ncbi:MAG: type IV pilin N-terminal domain-containing protein [Candidatus Thermoplasmatota archaeon]|nr:type IV pilin N-terminal domain-containing protein [Candidatus Thermoplasmatota archaeon]
MWKGKKKEAVSPVIAVILMVAITVVLAAVLFVMVQGIDPDPGRITAISIRKEEKPGGWLVSIVGGNVENTGSVDWYILTATGGRIGDKTDGNFTYNDNNDNGYIDPGDTIFIDDPDHQYRNYKFVILTGSNTIEITL